MGSKRLGVRKVGEKLKIKNLSKSFIVSGRRIEVLKDINLTIQEGEFVVIVGHSGCGKSTLLKIVAGLEMADSGLVTIDEEEIKEPNMKSSMIFQEHRLFPWLTIEKNVALGLKKVTKEEVKEKVDYYLKLVKLSDFKRAYPRQLSGGMSQRAAIARSLITKPKILLLDEPFGALDALTKMELQTEVKKIWLSEKNTMIMVTHDIEEAVYLADRIIVMSSAPGQIKDIIKVELGSQRDRGSAEFAAIKKKIYDYFFEDSIAQIEYTI